MRDLETILREIGVDEDQPVSTEDRARLGRILEIERSFPQGFWHPEDGEGMAEVVRGCLFYLDVEPSLVTEEILRTLVRDHGGEEDEDQARRHQIGRILLTINNVLISWGDARRFHAFSEDLPYWEDGEPVWLLLTDGERRRLIELDVLQPPDGLEMGYDKPSEQ